MCTSCNLPHVPPGREVCDDDARPSASGGARSIYFTLFHHFTTCCVVCFAWWWVATNSQMSCTSSYALALLVALLALAGRAQAKTEVKYKHWDNADCSGAPEEVETEMFEDGVCVADDGDGQIYDCKAFSDDIELKEWKKVRHQAGPSPPCHDSDFCVFCILPHRTQGARALRRT